MPPMYAERRISEVLKEAVVKPVLRKPTLDMMELITYKPVLNIPVWGQDQNQH